MAQLTSAAPLPGSPGSFSASLERLGPLPFGLLDDAASTPSMDWGSLLGLSDAEEDAALGAPQQANQPQPLAPESFGLDSSKPKQDDGAVRAAAEYLLGEVSRGVAEERLATMPCGEGLYLMAEAEARKAPAGIGGINSGRAPLDLGGGVYALTVSGSRRTGGGKSNPLTIFKLAYDDEGRAGARAKKVVISKTAKQAAPPAPADPGGGRAGQPAEQAEPLSLWVPYTSTSTVLLWVRPEIVPISRPKRPQVRVGGSPGPAGRPASSSPPGQKQPRRKRAASASAAAGIAELPPPPAPKKARAAGRAGDADSAGSAPSGAPPGAAAVTGGFHDDAAGGAAAAGGGAPPIAAAAVLAGFAAAAFMAAAGVLAGWRADGAGDAGVAGGAGAAPMTGAGALSPSALSP